VGASERGSGAVRRFSWPFILLPGLVFLTTGLPGCVNPGPPGVRVRLSGAQIPVELVDSWLRDAEPPRFTVEQVAPVYMSQHGFENLARGECDVACTDRPLTSRELQKFGDRQVIGRRVAFYGYALYVHPDNPLDAIFAKHLKLILRKRIRDWKELAGPSVPNWEGPIHVYGLSKGTRAGMLLSQFAQIWFAEPTWEVLDGDAEIIARVAADPTALGFATIGHDGENVRYLGLRMERQARPSLPSLEEIESERYGLAKLIYVYYVDPPAPQVEAVLEYVSSDQGRRAIESTDLWAVSPDRAAVPPPSADDNGESYADE
jgi:phosphate transport system substrate-binding protein